MKHINTYTVVAYTQYIMSMTLFQFAYLTKCKEKLIDFLIQHMMF